MNRVSGAIAGIERAASIAIVDVNALGQQLTDTLIGTGAGPETDGWRAGMPVTLLFAETEVALVKNPSGLISMRNRVSVSIVAGELA